MVQDALIVLTSQLTYGAKYGALSHVAWEWTEVTGKYKGCPYWTTMAIIHCLATKSCKGLRHEHVVPKKVFIDLLFSLAPPSPEAIRDICDRFLIGVVVTLEEDAVLNIEYGSSMPREFSDPASPDYRNPWLRYRRYPMIEVVPMPTDPKLWPGFEILRRPQAERGE